jgi:hypothetical protein
MTERIKLSGTELAKAFFLTKIKISKISVV